MGTFLQLVSGIYLIVVWTIFAIAVSELPPSMVGTAQDAIDAVLLLIAIGLSIPALILFGFAQLLVDNRAVRSNIRIQADRLRTMRTYHESRGP
jgi:hypothetical protein